MISCRREGETGAAAALLLLIGGFCQKSSHAGHGMRRTDGTRYGGHVLCPVCLPSVGHGNSCIIVAFRAPPVVQGASLLDRAWMEWAAWD